MADRDKGKYGMRATRGEDGQRKLTLEFSMGGLITASVALVILLLWAFILGAALGGGFKPEKAVPEIAKVLPQDHGGKQRVEVQQQPQAALKPEELHSIPDLRKQGAQPDKVETKVETKPKAADQPDKQIEKPKPKPEQPKAEALKPKQEATKPEAQKTQPKPAAEPKETKKEIAQPKKEAVAKKEEAKPNLAPQQPKATGEPRFRYVYQLAAYNRRDQADGYREKLASQGLKASLEETEIKGSPMFRVLVEMEGTEHDAAAALAKAGKAGGSSKPILRARKAL